MALTVKHLKAWARQNAPLASAVLAAQAFAEVKREQVDDYIRPIFEGYRFTVSPENLERGRSPEVITDPKDLYLTDLDDPLVAAFYADCDAAHRAHGFKGEKGHCPALEAESILIEAQNALIESGGKLFGWELLQIHGDNRVKCLELLMGACVETGLITNMFVERGVSL